MSIVKVIEVIAESDKSWDDAARNAVKDAAKSVRGIRHLYVEGMQATVENNKITKFRLNGKLSFILD